MLKNVLWTEIILKDLDCNLKQTLVVRVNASWQRSRIRRIVAWQVTAEPTITWAIFLPNMTATHLLLIGLQVVTALNQVVNLLDKIVDD